MLSIMVHFWRVANRLKNSGVKPSTPAAVPELMSIMVSTTCSPVSIAEDFKFWWLWGGGLGYRLIELAKGVFLLGCYVEF